MNREDNLIELARADVAGAVANVLRDVYKTGTDAEIRVARRCYFAALEAAGLVPPIDQICICPDIDVSSINELNGARQMVKGLDPHCPIHGHPLWENR